MKKITRLIFITLTLYSCQKEKFNILNLNGNRIMILGHGGMGISSNYPINSFESIVNTLYLGADGTELDIQMTKDSVLVAYHNEDLSSNTDLKGLINSQNWNDIRDGYYRSTPFLNYPVISLEQLFSSLENAQNFKFTFDCKLYTNNNLNQFNESFTNAIIKIIEKYKLENNVFIESQSIDFLNLLKFKQPSYKLFIYPSSFEAGLNIALSNGFTGITISTKKISAEQIKIAHDNNLLIAIWSIHSKSDNKEAIKKNPDFIQTDRLKNLIKLLK
jgi:glycerophosphoryl diester phosphodiesterase